LSRRKEVFEKEKENSANDRSVESRQKIGRKRGKEV